ncbi:MAG: hypothetical protein ACI9XO_001407 [Paraglaciecola sp.]|jgi:uncharacterized protein (DUF1501 family)
MKRRQFLKTTSLAASVPVFINGMAVSAMANSNIFSAINGDSDRVLVLIQLNGGNDGLNMVVPLDQYDNLANLRSNLIIPESNLLEVEDTMSFHPNMTGLKSVYDNGQLTVVQSVGYPSQNRSHFRSTDIWTNGVASDDFTTTGWLGRNFDVDTPSFPVGFPNEDCPDPFAIAVGSQISQTCQGLNGNYSMAINDPTDLNPLASGNGDTVPSTPYGDELAFLRLAIEQANAYGDVITAAAAVGTNMVDYPEDNALAQKLKNVALMISGGLQTKVYVVSLGGFDTHADQVVDGETTTGEHAVLMATLSSAIQAFQADLDAQELDKRVVGMTFSEFGRRIRSNGSLGTDHGDAAPLLLFGSCVNAGVIGDNPVIGTEDEVDVSQGVDMQFNFRNIYGSILMDWFEVEESTVQNVLFPEFEYLPVLNPCLPDNTSEAIRKETITVVAAPNPFSNETTLSFTCQHEHIQLRILNSLGQEVEVLIDKTLSAGSHSITFDGKKLAAGSYYYQLKLENGQQKSGLLTRLR